MQGVCVGCMLRGYVKTECVECICIVYVCRMYG